MQKVAFILVPSFSESEWLNKKLQRVTRSFIKFLDKSEPTDPCKHFEVESHDEIGNYLNEADYLVVASAGALILDRDHLWEKINNIPSDVGLVTHLMQFPEDETTWMDEQFYILKTSCVTSVDFSQGESVGPQLVRSEDYIHGEHTPLEVTLGEEATRTMKFGSKLIQTVLESGHRVVNFDAGWRYPQHIPYYMQAGIPVQAYVTPYKSTAAFESAHKTLTISDDLDESQQLYLTMVNERKQHNFVNVHSFEVPVERPQVETVIVPAAGMLGELTAYYAYAENIIFYDNNPNNIAFKKYLYENWNGKDYESFAKKYCEDNGLNFEPARDGDLDLMNKYVDETARYVYPNWDEIKGLNIKFIECDLITDIDTILAEVDGVPLVRPTTILHTSTILDDKYLLSNILYSEEEIETAKEKILENKNIFWYYPGRTDFL